MKYGSIISFLALVCAGCASYSRFAIDNKWQIPPSDDLTGIWKAVGDTNKKDYILIQLPEDLLNTLKNKKADSFERSVFSDEDIKELHASAVKDLTAKVTENRAYALTRFGYDGTSANYQQFDAYVSIVNNARFLNVRYRNAEKEIRGEEAEKGFFFIRLLKVSKDSIVTALVADTTLKYLQSSAEVRKRIATHINDKLFYSDTLHFYLVNKTHSAFLGLKSACQPGKVRRYWPYNSVLSYFPHPKLLM